MLPVAAPGAPVGSQPRGSLSLGLGPSQSDVDRERVGKGDSALSLGHVIPNRIVERKQPKGSVHLPGP